VFVGTVWTSQVASDVKPCQSCCHVDGKPARPSAVPLRPLCRMPGPAISHAHLLGDSLDCWPVRQKPREAGAATDGWPQLMNGDT
jgi:hypothetical protein